VLIFSLVLHIYSFPVLFCMCEMVKNCHDRSLFSCTSSAIPEHDHIPTPQKGRKPQVFRCASLSLVGFAPYRRQRTAAHSVLAQPGRVRSVGPAGIAPVQLPRVEKPLVARTTGSNKRLHLHARKHLALSPGEIQGPGRPAQPAGQTQKRMTRLCSIVQQCSPTASQTR
jgi:hypothetical protein